MTDRIVETAMRLARSRCLTFHGLCLRLPCSRHEAAVVLRKLIADGELMLNEYDLVTPVKRLDPRIKRADGVTRRLILERLPGTSRGIAAKINISQRITQRHLKNLIDEGLVDREFNIYRRV